MSVCVCARPLVSAPTSHHQIYKTTRDPTHHQSGSHRGRQAAGQERRRGKHAAEEIKKKETMAARAVGTQAASATAVLLLAVLLAAGAGGASAQSPSPSSQCTSVLVSLSPCLSYISGNVSTAPPSCCAQLGKVVQSDPQCLCVALSADPASLGLTVNRTRALGLPDTCKVQTPDVSNCKGGGAAAGAPVTSPGTGTTTPATGSKTTPATSSVPGAAAAASPRGSAGRLVAGFVAAAVVAGFAV